ncbi:MAG: dephospho-CoA kinase [Thermoguttaceae bacterium]|nr:dephospho-CoA kinase [Thermoguttaceae bacterium]
MNKRESNQRESSRSKIVVLGLVGGIGAGKSFATKEFVAQGAVAFNADEEARNMYDNSEVLAAFRARWRDVVDSEGRVDRAKLAALVFAPTPQGRRELDFLNAVLRAPLAARFKEWRETIVRDGTNRHVVVLDAPLLFEAGWDAFVDYVVFVDASEATRRRRIIERGWREDELERRERTQTPLAEKKARADFIIDADQDNSNMPLQVERILKAITRGAER